MTSTGRNPYIVRWDRRSSPLQKKTKLTIDSGDRLPRSLPMTPDFTEFLSAASIAAFVHPEASLHLQQHARNLWHERAKKMDIEIEP